MAIWPAGLEQKQFGPIREKPQSGVLRSKMDTGAPKTRKRFTAIVREVDIPIVLNFAHKAIFDTFFETTLGFGSLPFDWTDPRDDSTTVSYRFVTPVVFTKRGGEFTGTMKLEILP